MGPKHKRDQINHCAWCGKPTHMKEMQLPETPILEFLEEKINEYGRERIWGDDGDWSEEDLDSDFEAELLVYDEMLATVKPISIASQPSSTYPKVYTSNCIIHNWHTCRSFLFTITRM
jgi:hypothetical protein